MWRRVSVDCLFFCKLALDKYNLPCFSIANRISSSYHWILTCSRHDIAKHWWTTIAHSLMVKHYDILLSTVHSSKTLLFKRMVIRLTCTYWSMLSHLIYIIVRIMVFNAISSIWQLYCDDEFYCWRKSGENHWSVARE